MNALGSRGPCQFPPSVVHSESTSRRYPAHAARLSGDREAATSGDIVMERDDRVVACLIVLAYLILGLAHGVIVPPFENLDEIEHLGVVRFVAETGRLPVHGTAAAEVYHYRQEASQPPLYYLLSAGLVRALGLRADGADAAPLLNPWVACGVGGASPTDNRTVFRHDPNREAFPWQGTLLVLHVLRAWSTLLQAVTVLMTGALARLAFPRRRKAGLVAMAVVAFNPQFLLVASGVNNDNLVAPLVAIGLYLLLRTWREGLSTRRALGLGVVAGLAGLSKLSGWLLLVLAGLVVLALLLRSREGRGRLVLAGAAIPVVALAIAGWWFWRNWQLYDDLTGLAPMLALVGVRQSPARPLSAFGLMFRSFWGQLPCAFYPPLFYVPYVVLIALGLVGLAWGWRRFERQARWAAALFAAWFVIVVAGWVRWDAMTPATGGRLLFPALPAVALLVALGWTGLAGTRFRALNWPLAAALALLAGWTTFGLMPGFFAPPPRHDRADAVQPEHALDATLGESVQLLGYDVSLEGEPPVFDVTLYWRALAAMTEDYTLALQFVSPVPGDDTLRWNYNSWPGRGTYPTSAWQPGEVIADRYRFALPEAGFPTQAWDLQVTLYQHETGERLPVRVEGVSAEDRLVLDRMRIPGTTPLCPEEGRLSAEVRLGESAALTHAAVVAGPEATVVELCWQALQPLQDDYTVFVHLQEADGTPLDTGDGPPVGGAFPTSTWQPGDVIRDVHVLGPLSGSEEADRRVAVGLYLPADGSRLHVTIDGEPAADAAVRVWPSSP
jgi:4-amino-4-deoxy-L-arabinose transferase-like glycosyltransferase